MKRNSQLSSIAMLLFIALNIYGQEKENDSISLINFDGCFSEKRITCQAGFKIVDEKPYSGTHCLLHDYTADKSPNGMSILELGDYIPVNGGCEYKISGWVRNTVRIGGVYLGIKIKGEWDGPIEKWEKAPVTASIREDEWLPCEFIIQIPESINIKMMPMVGVSRKASGGSAYWDNISIRRHFNNSINPTAKIAPFKSTVFFRDINERTHNERLYDYGQNKFIEQSPDTIETTIEIDLPPPTIKTEIEILRAHSREIVSTSTSLFYNKKNEKTKITVPFSISGLPIGHYQINVNIINDNKNVMICKKTTDIIINNKEIWDTIVSEPLQGIDNINVANGSIYINGKIHELAHLYHVDNVRIASKIKNTFGISSLQVRGLEKNKLSIVDEIWRQGMYSWIVLHGCFDLKKYTLDKDSLREIVTIFKNHPGVIGWMLFDEPDARNNDPAMKQALISAVQTIREAGDKKPIWINLCDESKFSTFANISDILSYDNYPFPHGKLSTIQKWNDSIIKTSNKKRPFLSIQQMWSPFGERAVTNKEVRANAYLCMTQGMKDFSFYSWSEPGPFWNQIENNTELQSWLKNIMYETRIILRTINDPLFENIEVQQQPDGICFLLGRTKTKALLIAVNISDKIMPFSLSHKTLSDFSKCTALFEDQRPIDYHHGTVTDEFNSGEAHVYELTN